MLQEKNINQNIKFKSPCQEIENLISKNLIKSLNFVQYLVSTPIEYIYNLN
jgi:hypothetical protein